MAYHHINFILLFLGMRPIHATMSITCNTKVNFQKINKVKDVYSIKREKCNEATKTICTGIKKLRIRYFEMKPFTLNDPGNSKSLFSGILQHIIHIALTECCGNCSDMTNSSVLNHTYLTSAWVRNRSDLRYPIFSQEKSETSGIIPVIKQSGAVFIIKSALSPTEFGKAVAKAVMDIWPLLGLSLLFAYAAGVIIWLVDTWSNKDHFPRQFLNGTFEGMLDHD